MDDWLSYRLSDLILFSPQAYYRMFAQYHALVFPFHVVFVGSAIAVPALMRRYPARAERLIAGMLSRWWLWVAIAFHAGRYSTINWAARYFAVLFVVQALILAWYATRHRPERQVPNNWTSSALFVVAMVAPLASVFAGRKWSEVELIGMTPDPTAIATLALALSASRWRPGLAIIPLLWCSVGAATLWALDSPEAWIPILAGLFALGTLVRRHRPAS